MNQVGLEKAEEQVKEVGIIGVLRIVCGKKRYPEPKFDIDLSRLSEANRKEVVNTARTPSYSQQNEERRQANLKRKAVAPGARDSVIFPEKKAVEKKPGFRCPRPS